MRRTDTSVPCRNARAVQNAVYVLDMAAADEELPIPRDGDAPLKHSRHVGMGHWHARIPNQHKGFVRNDGSASIISTICQSSGPLVCDRGVVLH